MKEKGFGTKMMGRMEVYLPKNPSYSDRLLYLMTTMQLSQSDLAERSGISQATISNYLYKDRIPKLDIAAKLATALNVSLDWMAGLDRDTLDT